MASDVPREIFHDIFARLSIKTILVCTSVCKSWHSIINHSAFLNFHLNRPSTPTYNNTGDVLLVRSYSEELKEELYSLHSDDEYAKLDFPFERTVGDFNQIVGSCKGLVCLTNYRVRYAHDTILWNPTIRRCVRLPRPPVTDSELHKAQEGFGHGFGFGFDAASDDYKCVRIVNPDLGRVPPEVDVYSLNTGIWRRISQSPPYLISAMNGQVFLNGASHWVGTEWGAEEELVHLNVVSFNLGDEAFHTIELPAAVITRKYPDLRVVAIQGSLSLVELSLLEQNGSGWEQWLFIWVMKEYGVKSSWNELRIDMSGGILRHIGFRTKGELLFAVKENGDLISVDPETAKVKVLGSGVYGPREWYYVQGVCYTESLILLGSRMHVGQ